MPIYQDQKPTDVSGMVIKSQLAEAHFLLLGLRDKPLSVHQLRPVTTPASHDSEGSHGYASHAVEVDQREEN